MSNIYITLEKGWFEKNAAKAAKRYKDKVDSDGEGWIFQFDAEKQEITNYGKTLSLQLPGDEDDPDAPYLEIEYTLDTEDLVKLAEILIKQLNKAKA